MKQLILALMLLLLFSNQAFAESEITAIEESETVVIEESDNNTILVITSGCVGGAVIGTAIPIFGNIAGCIIGGFASWWYND